MLLHLMFYGWCLTGLCLYMINRKDACLDGFISIAKINKKKSKNFLEAFYNLDKLSLQEGVLS